MSLFSITGKRLRNNDLSPLDLLIVDSKNDLNVFLTAEKAWALCCGTAVEKVSSCNSGENQATQVEIDQSDTCCQSGSSTSGQSKTSIVSEVEKSVNSRGIKDLNEFAGTFLNVPVRQLYAYDIIGSFQIYAVKPWN